MCGFGLGMICRAIGRFYYDSWVDLDWEKKYCSYWIFPVFVMWCWCATVWCNKVYYRGLTTRYTKKKIYRWILMDFGILLVNTKCQLVFPSGNWCSPMELVRFLVFVIIHHQKTHQSTESQSPTNSQINFKCQLVNWNPQFQFTNKIKIYL